MKKKKLYIIRHGQTDYNKKGIVQGSGIDSPLNETGRLQATAFYKQNAHIEFDKIYTSELQRTQQSVALFLDKGLSHEILPGLNEISWGVKEGEEVSADPSSYYMQVAQAWRDGALDRAIEGGESPIQVFERQKTAIEHILKQTDEQQVLICMHGRAMRILLSQLLDTPLEEMDQYEHSNLCKYVVAWDGSGFTMEVKNVPIDISLLD